MGLRIAIGLAGVILLLWVLTATLERKLTFFPTRQVEGDPASFGVPFSAITVRAADGVVLHGWHCLPLPGTDHRGEALFFHGNGGNISHRLLKIRQLAELGLGVTIFDWRGYGQSEGHPSDAGILLDARAAWGAAADAAQAAHVPLGIVGESLGTLPAVHVAAENPGTAFLVLEGSFAGKRSVMRRTPFFWPFFPFVSGRLDIAPVAGRVGCPSLVLHARGDEVIPYACGEQVHYLLGSRSTFETLERGGHNDAFAEDETYVPRLAAFFDRVLPERGH